MKFYQVENFTSADHIIQINWFKVTLPTEVQTAVRLSIKSLFADVGWAQVTPFGIYGVFFSLIVCRNFSFFKDFFTYFRERKERER